jgi:Ca-activated chloride channel homolog
MTDFHFIRPLWLLALIPSFAIFVMLLRRSDPKRVWQGIVAKHLLPYMIETSEGSKTIRPHILLQVILIITTIALAGPTWVREPAPFADDTAALAIVIKVTPTMLAKDVQPTRLARAAQKISDLLEKRKGSKTALVAYAGSAHLVMPFTEDYDLIVDFAARLHPSIMPAEGDSAEKAVMLAQQQMSRAGLPGSILLIADHVSPDVIGLIKKNQTPNKPRVHVYGMAAGPDAVVPVDSPPASPLDRINLKNAAQAGNGSLVIVTPDTTDVDQLSRIVETEFTPAVFPDGSQRWRDFGFWLLPVIAILILWWFRPGWSIQYSTANALIFALMFVLGNTTVDYASDSRNAASSKHQTINRSWGTRLFFTPDQYAQRLYSNQQFKHAAQLFTSSMRQGMAWYRAGEFEKAAVAFGRTTAPAGMFNRGNALMLLGHYEDAILAYEHALEGRPHWKPAMDNIDIAKARLAKLAPPDDMVSQKGVGEDDEPDDIVFDDRAKNRENTNTQTIAEPGQELSDKALRAMWLRNVETNPADFLRRKFAYQYKQTVK